MLPLEDNEMIDTRYSLSGLKIWSPRHKAHLPGNSWTYVPLLLFVGQLADFAKSSASELGHKIPTWEPGDFEEN